MAMHTLQESCELTGKSKKTLYRKMDSGEISYKKNSNGRRLIETSELVRVFGDIGQKEPVAQADTVSDMNKEYIDLLKQQLTESQLIASQKKDYIDFLQQQLTASQEREKALIHRLESAETLLLEHQKSSTKRTTKTRLIKRVFDAVIDR